jgi:hypothetical protein
MTKSELLDNIEQVIEKIDVISTNWIPGDPVRMELDKRRDYLDGQQREVARRIFQENNSQYKQITGELKDVNTSLQESLDDITRIVQALELAKKFAELVDEALKTAAVLAKFGPYHIPSLFKPGGAFRGTLFRVEGKMSIFGGPKDTGMKPNEGLALFNSEQDMINHGLGDFLLPPAQSPFPGLGRRLNPEKPYLACRWWDAGLSKNIVKNSWVWVQNSSTGKKMRGRPVDYGPAEWTNRVADLSPGLARGLGLKTDNICIVTLTDDTSEFGIDVSHETRKDLPVAFSGPRIYATEEWGAAPARVSYFPRKQAEGIVIHHTEYPNREPYADHWQEQKAAFENAKEIQRDHFSRGWSDTGQHFTISQGGVITEGRHGTLDAAKCGEVVRGAHAPGANDEWWGIEIAGDNRDKFMVTPPQWDVVVALCVWLFRLSGRKLRIEPHDYFKETSCPGKIKEKLKDLQEEIIKKLGG